VVFRKALLSLICELGAATGAPAYLNVQALPEECLFRIEYAVVNATEVYGFRSVGCEPIECQT
jgi:hypothetical protein